MNSNFPVSEFLNHQGLFASCVRFFLHLTIIACTIVVYNSNFNLIRILILSTFLYIVTFSMFKV